MPAPACEYAVALPSPALRPYVERYVGYRMVGFEPGTHRGLPSHHLTFVITFDAPIEIAAMPDPQFTPTRFVAVVGGLHAAPALIRHDGNQHGVQLFVTPLGSRALFRRPAAALAGAVVPTEDALGPVSRELVDRLSEARTWPARFAILDAVLTRAVRAFRPPPAEVDHAFRLLVAAGGAVDVDGLAEDVGWSRRHLAERFRDEMGLPPKVMARVLRFERAKAMLTAPARRSLARIAADCGYADQAHLTREWRALAGLSPTQWMVEEKLPFFQDDERGADLSSGA